MNFPRLVGGKQFLVFKHRGEFVLVAALWIEPTIISAIGGFINSPSNRDYQGRNSSVVLEHKTITDSIRRIDGNPTIVRTRPISTSQNDRC